MGRRWLIPVLKVNYSLSDLVRALFIRSNSTKYILELEQLICDFFNVKQVLLASSGRSALYHILINLPQPKVFIPAYTCDVVVEAAVLANKKVEFARVEPSSLKMECPKCDKDSIVIATHHFGIPCDMQAIRKVCDATGAVMIEDCAGSLGTMVDDKPVGLVGDYAFFSFNSSKLITSPGGGGFIIAHNDENRLNVLKQSIALKQCTVTYKLRAFIKSIVLCVAKNNYLYRIIYNLLIRNKKTPSYIDFSIYKPSNDKIKQYELGFYNWQAYIVAKQFKSIKELIKNRAEMSFAYKRSGVLDFFDIVYSCAPTGSRCVVSSRKKDIVVSLCLQSGVSLGTGFDNFVCPSCYKAEQEIGKNLIYLPLGSEYSESDIKKIIVTLKKVLSDV